jgi:biofilm PGA synthesis N-glycosyltransferase PgaC
MLILINSFIFSISVFSILLFFIFYPLTIFILYLVKRKTVTEYKEFTPFVSFITVVHNAESLIEKKIENYLSLNYPENSYEIIIFSDGSTDETEKKVKFFDDHRIKYFSHPTHESKNSAINKAIKYCSGELIVFSDVDAVLESNSIRNLVKYFSKPEVGGLCGQKIICKDHNNLKMAQVDYLKFDSLIKKFESQIGSITSNEGKLCAIRKNLFQPIPPAVTDDLYICLTVVKQHCLFLFAADVKAYINTPSRNTTHEINRRRRIVNRDLNSVYLMRNLLNPFQYYFFSIRLIINKIIRRLLPVSLLLMIISSVFLATNFWIFKFFVFAQTTFYISAFFYWLLFQHFQWFKVAKRLTSSTYYFCIGNYGTFLGVVDFLIGKRVVKWKPVKTD